MNKSFLKPLCALTLSAMLIACGSDKKETASAPAAKTDAKTEVAKAASGPATGTSSVTGTIKFEGDIPKLGAVNMDADPVCKSKHSGAVASEVLVLGEGNLMANIMVSIKSGLPSAEYDTPSEAAVLDQKGCVYVPHILGVMAGQEVKILNSDGTLHNIHTQSKENKAFNVAMPAARTEMTKKFKKVEDSFKVKCDVHPWMGGWIRVFEHPFFDVTEKDGQFSIKNLPAGTYEIEAWHEKLGSQTASVTVGDGEAKAVDFTFKKS
ncbi:MAG: hypothetical protein DWQ06_12085 [Calditrichaeota bacterium]|nr:MAG: hypothetical protein DWQ06_12085 [Calditrichota bacterium]